MVDLTKSEKKIARRMIDKALNQDYINGMEKIKKLIHKWEEDSSEPQKSYLALFQALKSHDKALGRKFDGLTGSHYFTCIVNCFTDGLLHEEDLDQFPDELKEKINIFLKGF